MYAETINNFETASRVQLQGLMVKYVTRVPTRRLRAYSYSIVIIFVRAARLACEHNVVFITTLSQLW